MSYPKYIIAQVILGRQTVKFCSTWGLESVLILSKTASNINIMLHAISDPIFVPFWVDFEHHFTDRMASQKCLFLLSHRFGNSRSQQNYVSRPSKPFGQRPGSRPCGFSNDLGHFWKPAATLQPQFSNDFELL